MIKRKQSSHVCYDKDCEGNREVEKALEIQLSGDDILVREGHRNTLCNMVMIRKEKVRLSFEKCLL